MRKLPDSEIDSDAHRQLALKTAASRWCCSRTMACCRSSPEIRKIAVVGPLATSLHVLEGNYSGTPSRSTNALDGIRNQFERAQVSFAPGTNFLLEDKPVPASALSTPDGKPGLKAEYFPDPAFGGAPEMVRVEKDVNYRLCSGHHRRRQKSIQCDGQVFSHPPSRGTIGWDWTGALTGFGSTAR